MHSLSVRQVVFEIKSSKSDRKNIESMSMILKAPSELSPMLSGCPEPADFVIRNFCEVDDFMAMDRHGGLQKQ